MGVSHRKVRASSSRWRAMRVQKWKRSAGGGGGAGAGSVLAGRGRRGALAAASHYLWKECECGGGGSAGGSGACGSDAERCTPGVRSPRAPAAAPAPRRSPFHCHSH
ncbi:hypothetical protein JYU34_011370 [Plutella xylostella]|uniref:Uncharacterized protein n=1 Tax=Plutella xylostella TaxID=51655 RepID=A0ABQ7QI22_PLUXY|nr:hypothetical protein JYU34_011370 [Plutella xylostella]